MVEFIVAILVVVILITGITEFIGMATERGNIYSSLRGKVGKNAVESGDASGQTIDVHTTPAVETSETLLARGFKSDEDRVTIRLSKAMKDWIFNGKVSEIRVGDEVWMPGLSLMGNGEDGQ